MMNYNTYSSKIDAENAEIRKLICKDETEDNIATLCNWIDNNDTLYRPIDANNLTMLHYAIQKGKEKMVYELASRMQDQAGINIHDNLGRSPLHTAAAKGDIEIIKNLILADGDVNARSISGETPLMNAISFYQPKAAHLLLRFGANPFYTKIDDKLTCIDQAKQLNNTEIIGIIKKYEEVFRKISLILYAYESFGNTNKRSSIHNLQPHLLEKLIKYIIP